MCVLSVKLSSFTNFSNFSFGMKITSGKKWQKYLVIQYFYPFHRRDFLMSVDELNVCIWCSSWGFSLTMKTGTGKCLWIFCLSFSYFVRVQTKTKCQIKRKSSISTLINTFAIIEKYHLNTTYLQWDMLSFNAYFK